MLVPSIRDSLVLRKCRDEVQDRVLGKINMFGSWVSGLDHQVAAVGTRSRWYVGCGDQSFSRSWAIQ